MIRIIFSIVFSAVFSAYSFGQAPGSRNMTERPDSVRKNLPKIGQVSGTIVDGTNGESVPYASVAVISMKDSSIVGGALSDEKGKFSINELPMGRMRLQITFVGYATQTLDPFILSPMQPDYAAGLIRLSSSAEKLKEVVISADKPDLILSLDKKVYNMEKNIVNTGGSVTEAMQNIPSVSVDIDGNVSLRGSENVTILIDGKPSGMLGSDRRAVLSQIPANAVDQIEVITNPSAKYDASGMAGIINIKTKKEKMKGFNGTTSIGVGTNDKYNFALGLNNRTSFMNLFANYSYRHDERSSTGETTQYNYFPGQDPYSYTSSSQGKRVADFHTGKIGTDLFLNKWNTLGLSASINTRTEEDPNQTQYVFMDQNESVYSEYQSSEIETETNNGYDVNLDYRRTWAKSKREFSATGGYSSNLEEEAGEVQNSPVGIGFTPYQKTENDNRYSNLILQADFAQPISKQGKMEAGLKSMQRTIDNEQFVYSFDDFSDVYYLNTLKSDHFIYDEQILAAYALYGAKWKKFDYSAGLRAEQTLSTGDSKTMNETFKNDYLSFFPSVFLRYTLGRTHEFQVSYSKRVNRPDTRALNPYTDYSDSLFLRSGNPEIQPEFVQSYELAYTSPFGPLDLTATVYYRYTDDMISRFRTVDSLTGVSTMTFVNYNSSQNLGAELVLRYEVKSLGSLMGTFNAYRNTIDADNIESDLQSESNQWSARLNMNVKAGNSTSLQFTANYSSPRVSPTSKFKGMSGVDAGIKQDLWKGKGSLTFNITDIFNTRSFRISSYGDYFESSSVRTRESRVATLTLNYRFGKQDSGVQQKKKSQRGPQQGEGMDSIDY
ncbi:MAG: TonB-dependent receptor [Bacteroidia bacterium]|nr:TonB-dependent receptor [Bacteroidia bacterium]